MIYQMRELSAADVEQAAAGHARPFSAPPLSPMLVGYPALFWRNDEGGYTFWPTPVDNCEITYDGAGKPFGFIITGEPK